MAEKGTKTVKSSTIFHGVIVTSTIDSGSVIGITLPREDKRFFLLGPKDLLHTEAIKVFKESFPLFASSQISYRGQPLLALFGPDREAVIAKSKEIEIDYQLEVDVKPFNHKLTHHPVEYQWGDAEKFFTENTPFVEKSYTDKRVWSGSDTITSVKTYLEDDLLKIEVPTQWPFHVRDSVAALCGRTQKSVVVYPKAHFSPKDENLLHPTLIASIAALATLKSGSTVILSNSSATYKSPVTITRKTALDGKEKPIAEIVDATIDQGAYPLFTQEVVKQLLCGLIPQYPLEAFKAQIHIVESHSPPSHFYGDLGYSSALFSTEAHASALCRYAQINPSNWRLKHYNESKERSDVIESPPIALLRDLIGTTTTESDFSRHYAVHELQRRGRKTLSTFLNYSRGIGIACGAGISGFSSDSPYQNSVKIEVTLDAHNKVVINSSFFPSQKTQHLWKSIIAEELSVEEETIEFIENNTTAMVDTGPEVLSLDVKRAVMMIQECCRVINGKRFQDPLPITESVSARQILSDSIPLFSSENWGTLVIELEINTITLEIEARRVWGRFLFSNPPDIESLQTKIRHIINVTLHECNIVGIRKGETQPIIDIKVDSFGEATYPSSATSALRAMVMAASSAAISQALNCDVNRLPISSEEIIEYIRRKE